MGSALKKWPPKRRGEKMADRLLLAAAARLEKRQLEGAKTMPTLTTPANTAPEETGEVTIELHGGLSADDRRLWIFLLGQVDEQKPNQGRHQLPLSMVLPELGLGDGVVGHVGLEAAIERLTATRVKWEIVYREERVAVFASFLSATIAAETLLFQFSEDLLSLVRIPQQFALLLNAVEEGLRGPTQADLREAEGA